MFFLRAALNCGFIGIGKKWCVGERVFATSPAADRAYAVAPLIDTLEWLGMVMAVVAGSSASSSCIPGRRFRFLPNALAAPNFRFPSAIATV